MKANVFNIDGKKIKEINLPSCFSQPVREDIIAKVLEAKKIRQPYSPSLTAGKKYSAKGKIAHRRHVWKSQYGRGISRVPRKIFLRRGEQFHWEAAEVPQARGGMRAHPPKTLSITKRKINKKELKIAFESAISATANEKEITKKYKTLRGEKINLPFIVESKILTLKTKPLLESLKKILGERLLKIAIKRKKIRAGKGKFRGRRHSKSAGALLIIGNNEKLKTNIFDVKNAKNLNVMDLAKGGPGRLTIYTEQAIKELENKFKKK